MSDLEQRLDKTALRQFAGSFRANVRRETVRIAVGIVLAGALVVLATLAAFLSLREHGH